MIEDKEFCSKKDQLDLLNSFVGKNSLPLWKYSPMIVDGLAGFGVNAPMRQENFRLVNLMNPSSPTYPLSIKIFNNFIEKNNIKCKQILQVSAILLPKSINKKYNASINGTRTHNTFIYFVNSNDSGIAIYDQIFNTNHTMEHFNIIETLDGQMGKAVCFDGLNYHSIGYPEKSEYACFLIIDFVPELMESGGKGGLYRY